MWCRRDVNRHSSKLTLVYTSTIAFDKVIQPTVLKHHEERGSAGVTLFFGRCESFSIWNDPKKPPKKHTNTFSIAYQTFFSLFFPHILVLPIREKHVKRQAQWGNKPGAKYTAVVSKKSFPGTLRGEQLSRRAGLGRLEAAAKTAHLATQDLVSWHSLPRQSQPHWTITHLAASNRSCGGIPSLRSRSISMMNCVMSLCGLIHS